MMYTLSHSNTAGDFPLWHAPCSESDKVVRPKLSLKTSTVPIDAPSTRLSLLIRIRQSDDQSSWGLFAETYTPLVMRYCRRWGSQEADACDVAQTVFAIVARSIVTFEFDRSRGRFRGWLRTITCHELRRHLAKAARSGQGIGGESQFLDLQSKDVESAWMDEFNARIYECALERVRPAFEEETWQAFELTWSEGQKPAAAGARLRKPAAWISRAKYRVLRRLKEEIEFLAADVAVLAGRVHRRQQD